MSQPDDLGSVFDAHVRAEFVARDVDATMATMTDAPYVTHVPVLTGGCGREEVRRFYATYFVGHWPADTQIKPVSRTIGQGRVIDELIPSPGDQNLWAQSLRPMVMIIQGRSVSLFHASQQWSRMSP